MQAIAPNDVDKSEEAADLHQSVTQTAHTVVTEAKSALADANSFPVWWLNWTLSTLYFSAGATHVLTASHVTSMYSFQKPCQLCVTHNILRMLSCHFCLTPAIKRFAARSRLLGNNRCMLRHSTATNFLM